MKTRRQTFRAWLCAALGMCTLVAAGCAGLRVPRIDPTGERVFIWPSEQVVAASQIPGGASPNLQAQPVFTDPVFPQPTLAASQTAAAVQGFQPAGSLVAPQPVAGTVPPIPQDTLSIQPGRVLAPVGSEVILRAGICNTEGFLLTHQKVEWMIGNRSVGEFLSLGGRGWLRSPLLPWNKPHKIDNQYATGYTAAVPLQITRGTADPSDDVQVEPGEAWASVTSATEGTSRVTAFTPAVEAWAQRRTSSTIYWVDVQWTFPPPSIIGNQPSQVLTTTVLRQTDQQPLPGWIVRYEVSGGGAALSGATSGQVVEVPVDAQGRASIDVTPSPGSGGTTQIGIQLVRPERFAGSDMPRLVVGQGSTTINWSGGTPYFSPESGGGTTIPTYPIPGNQRSVPIEPSQPVTSTGQPDLQLEIHGQPDAEVGGQARFEVVVSNQGTASANGIVLTDRFDPGLSHLRDPNRTFEIENPGIGSLGVGESRSVYISFDVIRAGRLCHEVSIRCREGSTASQGTCVDATQPLPQKQARIEVRHNGPVQARVGESALFTIVVENVGEVPLTNIVVVDEVDRALLARPTEQNYQLVEGKIVWNLPRLEVGAKKRLDVQCECIAPSRTACSTVNVTFDSESGSSSSSDSHCVEILPVRAGGPAVGGQPAAGATTGSLQLSIEPFNDRMHAGSNSTIQFVVANLANVADEQLQLKVALPPNLSTDLASIRNDANVRVNAVAGELHFDPIATIRPGEQLRFTIPVNVVQPGTVSVGASIISRSTPSPLQQVEQIVILPR